VGLGEAMTISEEPVEFGPFRLFASQRRLVLGDAPVVVGSRALDILIMLVEHAGQVVPKQDLMKRAWSGLTVEEASLRAQVAALRRALGDGEGGSRYIANVVGRGYSFVAQIAPRQGAFGARPAWRSRFGAAGDPPRQPTRMVGRDVDVRLIASQLVGHRLVTIHGPGGIGKTVVALAVADLVLPDFADGIVFLNLSLLEPGRSVPDALAAELGLIVQSEDPTPGIVSYLRDRRAMVVFDCCEHVVASAALMAEAIFRETLFVRVLATSREPLGCEGEHVFPLSSLGSPPATPPTSLGELLNYPAALLFHDRIVAGGHRTDLSREELAVVADICRKLDGMALALELAAGRVGVHGLLETAALLDSHMKLTWPGRNTAPARHHTLSATLDWSYGLASVRERAVLRRLSVFVGPFTLDEAQAIASDEAIDSGQVVESLAQLATKSLVALDTRGAPTRYRLLDTTRAYAQGKLVGSGEESRTARAHALLCERRLQRREELGDDGVDGMPSEVLGNVRAALDWCFRPGGDLAVGIQLAAVATQFFFDLSLLRECREWAERALAALGEDADPRSEIALRSALGHGLMFTRGGGDASRAALERGLEIAIALDDKAWRFRLLAGLHMYQRRLGDFGQLLPLAREARRLAAQMSDPSALSAAHAMLGVTHHLGGDLASAREALTASLRQPHSARQVTANAFGFNRDSRILLARTLWLQGYPDQAIREAREADPLARQDPVSACLALIWSASLLHWVGDWDQEQRLLARLVQLATEHSLEPYKWVGVGFQGDVRVQCGDAATGVEMMRNALNTLRAGGYSFNTPWLGSNLAAGLAVLGHVDQALSQMAEALAAIGPSSDAYNLPDLWRIHGEILGLAGDTVAARARFEAAIALADQQGALSWRLRIAASLARLERDLGRPDAGRALLAETYGRFQEGFGTPDLIAARTLLDDLG